MAISSFQLNFRPLIIIKHKDYLMKRTMFSHPKTYVTKQDKFCCLVAIGRQSSETATSRPLVTDASRPEQSAFRNVCLITLKSYINSGLCSESNTQSISAISKSYLSFLYYILLRRKLFLCYRKFCIYDI